MGWTDPPGGNGGACHLHARGLPHPVRPPDEISRDLTRRLLSASAALATVSQRPFGPVFWGARQGETEIMKTMNAARGVLGALATLAAAIAFGPVAASAQEPRRLPMAFQARA